MEGAGKKAVIAMSGGVDSSVAAWLMQRRGCGCIGVTLKLFDNVVLSGAVSSAADVMPPAAGDAVSGVPPVPEGSAGCGGRNRGCCSLADVNDARAVAFRLGMPHYVLNFSRDFEEQVIRRFVESYERGLTPNPCIDCNRYIKFSRLLRRVRELDYDYLVTGHYARIEKSGDRFLLKKALDPKKDQSYVLYAMTREQLARTILPLGTLTKDEVRRIALEQGFVNANKSDSQDICFVPGGDYGRFIENYRGAAGPGGDIIDRSGRVLGRHRGHLRYTLGQRRGLGLSFPIPMYVSAKSATDNTVTLSPESSLYTRSLSARDINLIACDTLAAPLRVSVKTRYLQKEEPALAVQEEEDRLRIIFDRPQRAVTPGQAAVLYDGDLVVGGGTICAAGTDGELPYAAAE
jgi:tRNA-specific 2-thiouridylase